MEAQAGMVPPQGSRGGSEAAKCRRGGGVEGGLEAYPLSITNWFLPTARKL